MTDLSVWLDQHHVGWLRHDPGTERFSFDYADTWVKAPRAFPISPFLPLQRRPDLTPDAHSVDVRQFYQNLLPEGQALADAARAASVSQGNVIAMMMAFGGETAGAIRVLPSIAVDAGAAGAPGEDHLRLVTREELSRRIRERPSMPFSVWDRKVRLSIAGYQDKIAVYERGEEWFLVDGGRLASTVIVKPLPVDPRMRSLPSNEFICMQLAKACELSAATTRLIHLPEPVLLVDRFDRVVDGARVRRLHIIDSCQALGKGVDSKYERNLGGTEHVRHIREGVSYPKLFRLLEQSRQPVVDRLGLLKWAIFQVLVGNTDGHGKNVSFYYDVQGLQLAPMYDVCSNAALGASHVDDEYALAIGDAFNEREFSPYEWANFADSCGLVTRNVAHQIHLLASRAVQELPGVIATATKSGVPSETSSAVAEVVTRNCKRHLALAPQIEKAKSLVVAPKPRRKAPKPTPKRSAKT